jgi:predicted secreted protein with PEFG-CTERM motif
LKIILISALLVMLVGILIMSVLLPAYALSESCASDNDNICVKWYFIDENGIQIDQPPPVLIDTTHSHEKTIRWYVVGETGNGSFQFKTIPHVSKGIPGMIENCKPFSVEMFNESAQIKGQYECTIKASDDVGLGTLEIDLSVNNGKSLPFYDADNHFVGTSFQHSTDVVVGPNTVPEFGLASILVFAVAIFSIIIFLAKNKKLIQK